MQEGLGSNYALPYRMRKEAQSGDKASPGPHGKIHLWLSPAGRGLGCHLHHTLHYSVCVRAHARTHTHTHTHTHARTQLAVKIWGYTPAPWPPAGA